MSKVDKNTEFSLGAFNTKNHDNKINFTSLPTDVFFLICSYISPQDSILCRRVSRTWFQVFANAETSWNFMKLYFPRCREMRRAAERRKPDSDGGPNWTRIFSNVAERYYRLRSGKPRSVEKLTRTYKFCPVKPCYRKLCYNWEYTVFQRNEPAWTTDGDLLVYLDDSTDQLVAYDLETNTRLSLPFVTRIDDGYIVRRMRLACGVLVIEWCEGEPLTTRRHFLFRHYVLAFDVIRRSQGTLSSSPSIQFPWDITIRSEWRIHSPGLRAQIDGDVFYSAHTSNHYALYLWQNITSDIDPRDPLESLTIWDISKPSSYRASLDPTEANKPKPGSSQEGPTIINKFSREDLSFLNLQQRELRLREILIDDANVYFHEEDHRWLEHNPSLRQHEVRCTGFPFLGMGPRWVDECCAADGNAPMSFCPRAGSLSRDLGNRPLGFDSSRSRAWPGWAPCWRHEEFPYLTVSHMVDYDAGVRVVARKCFMMEVLSSFALPKITVEEERNGGSEVEVQKDCRFEDGIWKELFKGEKIMGDERWLIGEDTESRITIWRF